MLNRILAEALLGTPLTELRPLTGPRNRESKAAKGLQIAAPVEHGTESNQRAPNTPSSIYFVRNRMFYARAAINAKGQVTFGLRHIREHPDIYIYWYRMLTPKRCLESVPRFEQIQSYHACHAIYISSTI